MRIFLLFLPLFFISFKAFSTSTSFDQNLILQNKQYNLKLKSESTHPNLSFFLFAGSVSLIGDKLYQTGFFSPFGYTPESITNLSPLAYNNQISSIKIDNPKIFCNYSFLMKHTLKKSDPKNLKYPSTKNQECLSIHSIPKQTDIKTLVNRYLKE